MQNTDYLMLQSIWKAFLYKLNKLKILLKFRLKKIMSHKTGKHFKKVLIKKVQRFQHIYGIIRTSLIGKVRKEMLLVYYNSGSCPSMWS